MSEFREKFSPSRGKPMHAVVEARSMFRAIPRGPDEPKGTWLVRAGRLFGLTPSQTKKIEYNEVKDLRASRLDAMRAKLNELQEGAAKRRELLDGLSARRDALRGDRVSDSPRCGTGIGEVGGRSNGTGEGGGSADTETEAAAARHHGR